MPRSAEQRKQRDRGKAREHTADDRADDRHPRVRPVAAALALDRQERVRETGAEVTGRIDRVPRRPAERCADADDEECDGKRTERGEAAVALAAAAEPDDDEDEY